MTAEISKISIPAQPGIYLMKDKNGEIIYIGKAKNLKNRVKSYFTKNQNYKTQKLVEKISEIEFVLTDNESEAYLLESNMIKRYRPIFNIELKDQQRYTYLRVTDEKFPRLLVARRIRTGKFLGGGQIFGPFTSGSSKLLTIGTLRKAFKIRICKTLPKKACLEYHLGNCEAPCEFKDAQKKYSKHISDLKLVLKGKKEMKKFAENLNKEMHQASESLDYERAIELRDTLHRLGSLQTKQKMEYVENAPDEDYFGIKIEEHTAHVMMLRQTHGIIKDRERFSFDLIGDNTFSNFLYQFYTTNPIPKFIVVNDLPENKKFLELEFSKQKGVEVKIICPTKGKRNDMIKLILKNINLIQTFGTEPGLIEIQEQLELPEIPKIIECFDISNHGAQYAVGAMSQFIDGKPNKSDYRKFYIKTVSGRDDYSMISEIIKRRYYRLAIENKKLPDFILIDGGKGHLNAAQKALSSVRIRIPCASIAKREEEIFLPNRKNSIKILKTSSALKILQYARDEAHRFGVLYNRSLRKIKQK